MNEIKSVNRNLPTFVLLWIQFCFLLYFFNSINCREQCLHICPKLCRVIHIWPNGHVQRTHSLTMATINQMAIVGSNCIRMRPTNLCVTNVSPSTSLYVVSLSTLPTITREPLRLDRLPNRQRTRIWLFQNDIYIWTPILWSHRSSVDSTICYNVYNRISNIRWINNI